MNVLYMVSSKVREVVEQLIKEVQLPPFPSLEAVQSLVSDLGIDLSLGEVLVYSEREPGWWLEDIEIQEEGVVVTFESGIKMEWDVACDDDQWAALCAIGSGLSWERRIELPFCLRRLPTSVTNTPLLKYLDWSVECDEPIERSADGVWFEEEEYREACKRLLEALRAELV